MQWRKTPSRVSVGLLFAIGMLFPAKTSPAVENTPIFPQFVTGGGYVSVIALVNTSSTSAVTGTLWFYNQNGTARSVALENHPAGVSLPGIKIPPKGTVSFSTAPGGSQLVIGMVKFVSDNRAGGIVKFVFDGGQIGVLSAEPVSSGIIGLR
jgi:hypothetical protein